MFKAWSCAVLITAVLAQPGFAHAAEVITISKNEGMGLITEMTLRRQRGDKRDSDAKPYWIATRAHNPPLAIFDEDMKASSLDCPDFQLVLDAIEAFEVPKLGPLSRRIPDPGFDQPMYQIDLEVSFGEGTDYATLMLHGGKNTPLESLVQGSLDRLGSCLKKVKR